MKRQFKYADDRRVPFVIVIGSDEAAQGHVTLRNMESGAQQSGPLGAMLDSLSR
jgi:histidyl-tRNA synthetase